MKTPPLIATVLLSSALLVSITPSAAAATLVKPSKPAAKTCPRGNIPQGGTCISTQKATQEIAALVQQAMQDDDLKAVILRVTVGEQNVMTMAFGESMTGVPATTDMHFRNGSVAIAYLTTVLLQLDDEKKLSIDDPLSKWFPDLPASDHVTLRMLASSTSGYADYVPDAEFEKALYADVFRQWTPQELLDIVMARPMACEPGTCFNYSHGNFVLLGEVMQKVTGQPVAQLIQQRILRPLGLRNTASMETAQIQTPVLHAFSAERGTYEESTYWNPSWTLAKGAIMTSDIADIAKSIRAIGMGRLVSRSAHQQQLTPSAANPRYGLGILIVNDWVVQNPSFAGYAGIGAYQTSTDITIAVSSTKGPKADVNLNYSQKIFGLIANYLDPANPLPSG